MNLPELKKTIDSDVGKELKSYLLMQLMELRQIDNIKEYGDPKEQTIELKAQKKAFEKLRNVLGEIMTIEEQSDGTKEKDSYFSI